MTLFFLPWGSASENRLRQKTLLSVKDISGQNNEEGLTATKPQHQDYDFLSPYLARRSCIDFLSELIMLRTDELPWQKQVKTSDFWLLQWIWLRFVWLNRSTISMKTQGLHGAPWQAVMLTEKRNRQRWRRGQTHMKSRLCTILLQTQKHFKWLIKLSTTQMVKCWLCLSKHPLWQVPFGFKPGNKIPQAM